MAHYVGVDVHEKESQLAVFEKGGSLHGGEAAHEGARKDPFHMSGDSKGEFPTKE
jgi:hypothetical protein